MTGIAATIFHRNPGLLLGDNPQSLHTTSDVVSKSWRDYAVLELHLFQANLPSPEGSPLDS